MLTGRFMISTLQFTGSTLQGLGFSMFIDWATLLLLSSSRKASVNLCWFFAAAFLMFYPYSYSIIIPKGISLDMVMKGQLSLFVLVDFFGILAGKTQRFLYSFYLRTLIPSSVFKDVFSSI